MIETICEQCGNRFKVDAQLLGKKGRCDKCKGVFKIAEAPPLPPSNTPMILVGVAGLVILGVGAFMLFGNETKVDGPGKNGEVTKKTEELKGPRSQDDKNKAGSEDNTEGKGKKKSGDGKKRRDPKSDKSKAEVEAEDQAVRSWSLKPSLSRTDVKNLELGRVILSGGKRVVVNGRTSFFKVPYDGFPLYLPRGKHRVSQGSDVQTVSVSRSYGDHYYKEAESLTNKEGEIDYQQVVVQIVNELGHPQEAYLLNLLAHHYLKQKKYDAARRVLFRALAVDPTFAPAHLNLSWVYLKQKKEEEAKRELRLAEDMDATGTFALERGMAEIRHALSFDKKTPVSLDPALYQFKLTVDDPVVDACFLFARFAKTPLDAIAAHNNAALRLLKLGHYEQAQGLFFKALKTLSKQQPTVKGRLIATTIFANLARLYNEAKWSERREIPMMEQVFPTKR